MGGRTALKALKDHSTEAEWQIGGLRNSVLFSVFREVGNGEGKRTGKGGGITSSENLSLSLGGAQPPAM